MTKGTTERRVHTRHDRTFEVQGSNDSGSVTARMVASNLSLGGVYCTSDADFPEMTRVAVRMLLPGPPATGDASVVVDAEAVVVRRRELPSALHNGARFELALFFTGITRAQREQLRSYLERTV